MHYFKHYSTASDSKSINAIFDEFGHKGIAFWWLLVELCCDNWDGHSEPEFEFHKRTVATKLKSSSRSVEPWLELCSDLGMCAFALSEKTYTIIIPKLLEIKTSRTVIKNNKKQLPVYKEKKRKEKNIYSRAVLDTVDHLNIVTGKNFKSETKATVSYITARLKDGYSVDDLKSVIDTKSAEWLNTSMEKYLRPSTLFNSEKFEGYLNESIKSNELPQWAKEIEDEQNQSS